jgi:hypothetical protein
MIVISFTHLGRVIGNILEPDNLLKTDMTKLVKEYTESSGFMLALRFVQAKQGEPVVIYIAPVSQSYYKSKCMYKRNPERRKHLKP